MDCRYLVADNSTMTSLGWKLFLSGMGCSGMPNGSCPNRSQPSIFPREQTLKGLRIVRTLKVSAHGPHFAGLALSAHSVGGRT